MIFENSVIERTVQKLIQGQDYREEVVNAINISFLDFTLSFFKKIVNAKFENRDINIDWYKENFICKYGINPIDAVINAGLNKKTVSNIYGSSQKEIMLNAAESNYDYLSSLLKELENDVNNDLLITIKITYNNISVELSLSESLIVINTLATKKIQIRGGAWSSIGKKVEKPLLNELCKRVGVPEKNINNSIFKKDKNKPFDREIDYKLINSKKYEYKIEVKLMGKGNPESADVVIARDTHILVADTLSEQNKCQLKSLNIEWLELKNNNNILDDFKKILKKLDIPYNRF